MSKTEAAFAAFREFLVAPRAPRQGRTTHPDQYRLMTVDDGLRRWVDGSADDSLTNPPLITSEDTTKQHLWVVRDEDVVHSPERSAFGSELHDGVIKHTNLTGGEASFSGGELIFVSEGVIVLNGRSGRYGPVTAEEMTKIAQAFAGSGFGVWSMGFDEEANWPLPFIGVTPTWFPPR